ncbi:25441_t:CDS:2, partial [Gigaspora margarita]
MTKKNNNQIKITVYGYDVATTEEATYLVGEKLSQLKLKFSGPKPFPTKKRLRSVPISPHKHKTSQEQFTWEIHKRVIHITNIPPQHLESLEKLKVPGTAHLELKKLLHDQKRKENKLKIREKKLEKTNNQLTIEREKIESKEKKLQQEEKRISEFANQLFRKEELFTQQLSVSSKKERDIQEEMEKINQIKKQVMNELGKIIPMSKEEAKKNLFFLLKEEVDRELEGYKEEKIKWVEKKAKEEGSKLICLALEKCSSELVFTKTTDTLLVENPQIISKIIGREGRNINAFQRVTGTELIIDRESDEQSIQISSFNSLRREIGLQTLRTLIKEARFSPLQIEKTYQKVSSEIDELIVKTGTEILQELELNNVHSEL